MTGGLICRLEVYAFNDEGKVATETFADPQSFDEAQRLALDFIRAGFERATINVVLVSKPNEQTEG